MSGEPGSILLLIALQNAALLIITLGVFWLGIFALRLFGRRASYSLSALGLSKPASGYLGGTALGVAVGAWAIIASLGLNAFSRYALETLGYPVDHAVQQPLMQGVRSLVAESPGVTIPLAFVVVAVVGPAVEELLFRGAVFNGLHRLVKLVSCAPDAGVGEKVAFVLSMVLSSALFASLHLELVLFSAIFVLAASLCWLFRRTGSLLAPIAAHATFNAFTVAVLVLGSLGVLP